MKLYLNPDFLDNLIDSWGGILIMDVSIENTKKYNLNYKVLPWSIVGLLDQTYLNKSDCV